VKESVSANRVCEGVCVMPIRIPAKVYCTVRIIAGIRCLF
jgi:hypothetical protein